jgi:hypothetical protein
LRLSANRVFIKTNRGDRSLLDELPVREGVRLPCPVEF